MRIRMKLAVRSLYFMFAVWASMLHAEAPIAECELSAEEAQLAAWLTEHPEQRRVDLTCDPFLQDFAASRAKDMADRDYFGHVTPEREGPNELLRRKGYVMPKYYVGGISNSVESILAGERNVEKAWKLLLDSPTHRDHLLGNGSMYEKQQRFGIAHLHQPDSKYAHYWIIVIVENGTYDRPITCTPPPSVCIVH